MTWDEILNTLNTYVLSHEDLRRWSEEERGAFGTILRPPASAEQLEQLRTRLRVKELPPSYEEFLKITNGLSGMNRFIYEVWSTNQVEWFYTRWPDWAEAYIEPIGDQEVSEQRHRYYGEDQLPEIFITRYLRSCLEISDVGDSAILLLNPEVVTDDGEWEAWFFANWAPGATRFPSFYELMRTRALSCQSGLV